MTIEMRERTVEERIAMIRELAGDMPIMMNMRIDGSGGDQLFEPRYKDAEGCIVVDNELKNCNPQGKIVHDVPMMVSFKTDAD